MNKNDCCFYCDQPATKLCDGVLAVLGERTPEGRAAMTIDPQEGGPMWFTCDRPLCQEHAVWIHNVFYDRWVASPEVPNLEEIEGEIDTFDLCRQCVREGRDESNLAHQVGKGQFQWRKRNVLFVFNYAEGRAMQLRRLIHIT